jgi:hypothetical protein
MISTHTNRMQAAVSRMAVVRREMEANRAAPISHVDKWIVSDILADFRTPREYRFKRASALNEIIKLRTLGEQMGKRFSTGIQINLRAAAHWRRLERETPPSPAMQIAA